MTGMASELRALYQAGRPLIEAQIDLAEQVAALRDAASDKGFDWGQIKALLKAQIQDERDESGGNKRVAKVIEKADNATSYADMLGLAKVNENNFSGAHDAVTDEVIA